MKFKVEYDNNRVIGIEISITFECEDDEVDDAISIVRKLNVELRK